MNPKVDLFLEKTKNWKREMTLLRQFALDCGLTEEFKWMHPCYTFENNNIIIIHGFKEYCAILFHKGVLLQDADKILIQQTENVQSARQIRFTNLSEIKGLEEVIKNYIFEAIELEKAGLEVRMKKTKEFDMPEELAMKFEEDSDFQAAFEGLTPGRQRGYLLYFSAPKQAKTRIARIESTMEKIYQGKGLRDDFRSKSK